MEFYRILQNLQNFMCYEISYKPLMIIIWKMFRRFASGVLPWKGLFSGIKDVPSKLRWPCWHCNAHTQRASQSPCNKVLWWAFVLFIIWDLGWFGRVGLFKPRLFQMLVRQWVGKLKSITFYNNLRQFLTCMLSCDLSK